MKSAVLALVLSAVAGAQYLEETIWLPDSFRAVINPANILYNSGSNTIYVGDRSRGGIVVLDGITLRKAAQVFLPDDPELMLYAPEVNKVYCADKYYFKVYVIDGAGHRLIAEIPGLMEVRDLCYNPVTRRVYCASQYSRVVTAIDANADTVVASVAMPTGAQRLCCNWRYNKVYCADEDSGFVYVIDGAGDSILTWLYVSEDPGQMLYNPLSNRVYCPDESFYDLGIIDAGGDTLIRWITTGAGSMGLCLNLSDNELYVTDGFGGRVFVFCGTGDSLKSRIDVGSRPVSPVYDSVTNRVYFVCQNGDSLVAMDATGDTVVGRVRVGNSPAGLCIDTRQRRAFVADEESRDVVVFDIPADTVVDWLDFPLAPEEVCTAGDDGHLYCSGAVPRLMVVDPGTAQRVSSVLLPGGVCATASAPELDKLYVCCTGPSGRGERVCVLDCSADTLVADVPLPLLAGLLAYRPHAERPKVYAVSFGYARVAVLDANADSVLGEFSLREGVLSVAYASGSDRLLTVDQYGWMRAIDCSSDSLADSLCVGGYPRCLAYVPGYDYAAIVLRDDNLAFVDAGSMSEVGRVGVGITPDMLEYCGALGKLYCFEDTTAIAVSVESLQVVGSMTLPGAIDDAAFDSAAGRLLGLDSDSADIVTLIDCIADTLLATVSMGQGPCSVVWSERWQRFFVADRPLCALLVVVDSVTVGLMDRSVADRTESMTRIPTVVRNVLAYRGVEPVVLLDITGRKAMDLQSGENDIRHLAPGVYFLVEGSARGLAGCASRIQGFQSSGARKIVIQH